MVFFTIVCPEDSARRNAINPHLGRQFFGQSAGHHHIAGLGNTVNAVTGQWLVGVDVGDIDDGTRSAAQFFSDGLAEKVGPLEVAVD